MGNYILGSREARIEDHDHGIPNQAYLYPPKNGNYFSSHFIMGGERFDTCQPEMYLFGENLDLNFLGAKPTPFPYTAPLPHEPTRTLRALVNIRKESLRFIKIATDSTSIIEPLKDKPEVSVSRHPSNTSSNSQLDKTKTSVSSTSLPTLSPPAPECVKKDYKYNIEFTFDSDVKVAITVYYLCQEEMSSTGLTYTSRDVSFNSETFYYKRGSNQQFNQPTHIFEPTLHDEDDLMYRAFDENGHFDSRVPFPVVIHCVSLEGDEPRQSHALIAVVERNQDGSFSLKPFKQKIFIDGLCYLLQEIYGIENKSASVHRAQDQYVSPEDDLDDNGAECVICMSDSRDTLILPCRHLCLCNACADSLRYQANNCPICRAPFRALLQIRAVRKSAAPLNTSGTQNLPVSQQQNLSGSTADLVELPPGYEPYPLLEALNGPSNHQPLSGHGMYSFRPEVPAVEGTPNAARRTRRDKREHRRNSSSTSLHSRARMPIPVSPSTPEVVVSGTPLSPNKDGLPPSREMDKWPVPAKRSTVAAVNTELETLTDQESTSSTSSTNGAAAESTRLLVDEDDPPPPVPRPRGEKNIDIEAVRSHGTSSGSRTASHNGLPDTRV